MAKINCGRVLLGGMLAGVIINAVDMAFHWVLTGANWWFFRALTQPIENATEIVRYAGLHLLVGIAAVWMYAAARPRFGPGPRTAAYIGAASWIIGDALPTVAFVPLLFAISPETREILPIRGWVIAGLVHLGRNVVATVVGASLYKE